MRLGARTDSYPDRNQGRRGSQKNIRKACPRPARNRSARDSRAGTPFLEKPPLSYWMSAAAISLFGDSAAGARVPNLLYAAITALAVGALALAMQPDAASALLAALIAASALTAFRVSAWLAPDACLLAGSALALLGAWRGYRASAGRHKAAGYTLM